MSNQMFAWLLVMESGILSVFLFLFFLMSKRKEPVVLLFSIIKGLYCYFFYLLGGGVRSQATASIYIYRTAQGLLCAQSALILILGYYFLSQFFKKDTGNNEKKDKTEYEKEMNDVFSDSASQ